MGTCAVEYNRQFPEMGTKARKTIYVSHPIKGLTTKQHEDTEAAATVWCADRGHKALLPRTIPPGCTRPGMDPCVPDDSAGQDSAHTHACYMRGDLIAMLGDCDEVLMMPGWEKSVGARAELNAALITGMPVRFYLES